MPAPKPTSDDFLHDWAADTLDELRQERNSLKAANEGWKRAFCDLHDALDKVADGIERQVPATKAYLVNNGIDPHFADVLLSHYGDFARCARDALYTEED